MKKIIFALVLLIFSSATSLLAFEGDKFGKPLTLTELTKVSEIEKSPQSFVGKRVLISGTVVEVCSTRGCWMDIASDTPFQNIQIKVVDGEIVFPMEAKGRNARVEGIVEKLELSHEQALEWAKHKAMEQGEEFDPATITGPTKVYRIRGLGAVIM